MNEIIGASKSHHLKYSTMKKTYTNLVIIHVRKLPKIKQADFEINWYCKDKDNIMAGQKFIFDGLVSAGIIENDGWAQIGNVKHIFLVDKRIQE